MMNKIDTDKWDEMIYTVTDLNVYVRSLLSKESKIQNIWVKGEISNFTHHNGMHMYFVLKDENSEINCAMFKSHNKDIDFEPEEGLEVLCRGDVGLYLPRGQYQLVVKEMIPGGKGKLYLKYEQLKKKLKEEGLFEEKHKKPIPYLPRKIGIVTSAEGAALRDMVRSLRDRFENIDIMMAPAKVQGEGSAEEIVGSIKKLGEMDVDTIIVGRGGGSIEDLWSFNEEIVARAIFKAKTPIVSAVGHETDFLISDFVSDARAKTPTAAAELVVPEKKELLIKLREYKRRSDVALKNRVSSLREKIENIKKSRSFTEPLRMLEDRIQELDEIHSKITKNWKQYLKEKKQKLETQEERLKALGPNETMGRGYSIIMDDEGDLITSVEDVNEGESIDIRMIDGELKAKIKEVERWKKKKKN